MIKKTIAFRDLDDQLLTEDFYFGLNAAEITEIVVEDTDLMTFFEKIAAMQESGVDVQKVDGAEVMRVFKKLLQISVGKRSEDGRRFMKSPEIRDDFLQTDAYSELFVEFCTDASKAAEFVNGILPSNFAEIVARVEASSQERATETVQLPASNEPDWVREGRVPTNEELKGATPEQIQLAFQRKAQGSEVTPSQ